MPLLLLLSMLGFSATAAAQVPVSTAAAAEQGSAQADSRPATLALERIRGRLRVPTALQLRMVEMQPDFSVRVDEQRMIDEMLSQMDFRSGPAPAGGIYNWEQQRMLSTVTNNPLLQPFAAFSASEFFTLAAENIARVYLTNRVKRSLAEHRRENADESARREVDAEIAAYCADQANPAVIALCSELDR